ncbi:DUF4173 domain-containing protein [Hymenobacter aerilatus]|uniref:DUF4173 domain-containing protein n=1 Tax=Hymenobacter aerilatus TaxID=2932251 RepID=A0A8T9SU12_9BACT|nr:DUF4173 domain-containing protein [Hymenobacter aerilatus]UOR05608.1 DUF4173 domain-containing protein [Hymenobacter aerilatus]
MATYSPSAVYQTAAAPTVPPFPLTTLQKLALPVGAILFDVLFWHERMALNMLVYTVFVLGVSVAGLPRTAPQWRSGYCWLLLMGTLLSAVLVAVYASGAAQLAAVVSLAGWLGYRNQPHLRLVLYAVLTSLLNLVPATQRLFQLVRLPANLNNRVGRGWFYGRLLVLPLAALAVFHVLFVLANPKYEALTARFWELVGEALDLLFSRLSVPHVLFFLLGLVLTAGALLLLPLHYFADHESRFGEFVQRQRDRVASLGVRHPDFRADRFPPLGLRREYLMAVSLLVLVNGLLLVVNLIDISWIWIDFQPTANFDLTQFVHEGTYVLILSILVAMGIVLWFFRRNLNFYPRGLATLRWLATVWVVQNAVLAVSVGLRNYYYIIYTGLAYKRIGVYGFLLLTFFGLLTVLLKIWQRRSAYSLVRLNMLAAYVVLLLLAAGNWEIWMVRYNLQTRFQRVDYGFLLDMPDRVLPELAATAPTLAGRELVQENDYNQWVALPETEAQARLQQRIIEFQALEAQRRWPSRSWADWQAIQTIKATTLTHASQSRP